VFRPQVHLLRLRHRKEPDVDIVEALTTRKSIRGFKPEPVRREVLSEIL
jgi:hypothetical protein